MPKSLAVHVSANKELKFSWANADKRPVLYVPSDAAQNKITITLTNQTGGVVTFPAGKPVAVDKVASGQSALFLMFNGILDADDAAAVTWKAGGWAGAAFSDTTNGPYLSIAPVQTVTLQAGAQVVFTLSNVAVKTKQPSGNVILQWTNITGFTPLIPAVQVFVNVAAPPVPANRDLSLLVGFAGTDTVLTGANQTSALMLYLTNPGSDPLVPGGAGAWGPQPPTFTLSFIYGSTAGALTTTAAATGIEVNFANGSGNQWTVQPQTQGQAPSWELLPSKAGSSNVLGADANATVAFTIDSIVCPLEAGLTHAHISYANIPGYNDGFFTLQIVKVNPVSVSITPSKASIDLTSNPDTSVVLAVTAQNASYVTVTNTPLGEPINTPSYNGTVTVNVQSTTTFTALATDAASGQVRSSSTTVTVTPDLGQTFPKGTVVMWSGAVENIPAGWHLCDGSTFNNPDGSTWVLPNLINRFVMGAGTTPGNNLTGDGDSHSHTTAVGLLSGTTSQIPDHSHSMTFNTTGYMSSGDTSHYDLYYNTNYGGDHAVDQQATQTTSTSGGHSHSVSVNAGTPTSSSAGPLRPDWYSLAYIVKTF